MMEELLILCTDNNGLLHTNREMLKFCLRGCILIDLCLLGKIKTLQIVGYKYLCHNSILVVNSERIGDPILDEALAHIASCKEPRTVHEWRECLSGQFVPLLSSQYHLKRVTERCKKYLVEKRLFYVERTKMFVVFKHNSYFLVDLELKRRLMKRITTCMISRKANLTVTQKDLCFSVFAGLLRVVSDWRVFYTANEVVNIFFLGQRSLLQEEWNFSDELLTSILHCICRKRIEIVV